MGKKTKPKRNGDIDNNLEARALRKAAEHKPKQLVDSYGTIPEQHPGYTTVAKEVARKSPAEQYKMHREKLRERVEGKERKVVKWNVIKEVENTTPENVVQPVKQVEHMTPPIIKNVCKLATGEKTKASNSPPPKAPRLDKRKMDELAEKRRLFTINRLRKKESVPETEDMLKLNSLPRIFGNSNGISKVIAEVKERNDKKKEIANQRARELEKMLMNILNDEFKTNLEFIRNCIVLEELRAVKNNFVHPMEKESEEEIIPTQEGVNEARQILKKFFQIRKDRVNSCINVEIKRNKISDNYADMLRKCDRNVELLQTVLNKRKVRKCIGYRVLTMSTKLLERILIQSRQKYKTYLLQNSRNSCWKQWEKNLKSYDSKLLHHEKNKKGMNEYIHVKECNLKIKQNELVQLDTECLECGTHLEKARNEFEKESLKSRKYRELTAKGEKTFQRISEMKHKNKQVSKNLEELKEKIEHYRNEKVNTDNIFEEVANVKEETEVKEKEWRRIEQQQLELKELMRLRTGMLLKEEEKSERMKSCLTIFKKEISILEKELEEAIYQKKCISLNLKQNTRKMNNFRYRFCDQVFLRSKAIE